MTSHTKPSPRIEAWNDRQRYAHRPTKGIWVAVAIYIEGDRAWVSYPGHTTRPMSLMAQIETEVSMIADARDRGDRGADVNDVERWIRDAGELEA